MKTKTIICAMLITTGMVMHAQSPFSSNKQSLLLSNAQSGASERWVSLFAPGGLTSNYRLILPATAPSAGQFLNIASISGSDYTTQWITPLTGNGTSTQVAYWSSSSGLSSSSSLYWDNTNGRLGIGTSTPAQKLEVMNGNILLNNNNNTSAELRIAEPSTSGSNYTAFKTQPQSSDITYTLPDALPTINGSVLAGTTSGVLSWSSPWSLGNIIRFARKTTDESVSNSTLQNDDHLSFTVDTNEVWEIDGVLNMDCSSTSQGGIKLAFAGPTGSTINVHVFILAGYNTQSTDEIRLILDTPGTALGWTSVKSNNAVYIKGIFTTSTTAGTLQLQWALNNGSSETTTVKQNSYIKLLRIQ